MTRKLDSFKFLCKFVLGLDKEWQSAFDNESDWEKEILEEKWANKGLHGSGMSKREINRYLIKRKQEKKDEFRKRLIEGLGVIPSWLALILSIVAILVSILK